MTFNEWNDCILDLSSKPLLKAQMTETILKFDYKKSTSPYLWSLRIKLTIAQAIWVRNFMLPWLFCTLSPQKSLWALATRVSKKSWVLKIIHFHIHETGSMEIGLTWKYEKKIVLVICFCPEIPDQTNKQTSDIPFLISKKILVAMWRLEPWYRSAWTKKPSGIDLWFCSSDSQCSKPQNKQANKQIPYSPKDYFY